MIVFFVDYLEKAIYNTCCECIQASLVVQHAHSLDQIEFLKRRLLNQIHGKDGNQVNELVKTFEQHCKIPNMNSLELDSKDRNLFSVVNEQDSLIDLLIGQHENESSPNKEKSQSTQPNCKLTDCKSSLMELKKLSEKLKKCAHDMTNNLDKAQQEIQTLQDENSQLRKELVALKKSNSNKTFPELPPLEPPKLLY